MLRGFARQFGWVRSGSADVVDEPPEARREIYIYIHMHITRARSSAGRGHSWDPGSESFGGLKP